jgi:putative NIF3 family GTP cyclohydrolase 1 type 2
VINQGFSRREFIGLLGAGAAANAGVALGFSETSYFDSANSAVTTGKLTAGEVMERIKRNVHVPWRENTVDTIKGGGSPDIVVTGIVTSFMATLDVLQKSVKAGNNLVLTHEPTFWSNLDGGEGLTTDPLYLHKLDYIRQNGLFVHRFHDHWHARKPDGINEGWNKVMGWDKYEFDKTRQVYELPATLTLEAYAQEVKRRLRSDSVRVVGDPQLKVRTVSKGSNKIPKNGAFPLRADVTVTYEPDRENDNVEWERDGVLSGQMRGFIIVSHNRLEEYGMENCAEWCRTFISEVPIQFIPSGDPFWRTVAVS